MPFATGQTDRLYPSADARARYVHYTSAEAALNIIRSKRLWLRNTTCMADYSEVQHGYTLLRDALNTPNGREFAQSLDKCAPGVAREAFEQFDRVWPDIRAHTYIGSLSEHHTDEDICGRLSMWRAFGGAPSRVALVVSVPYFTGALLALSLVFSPVGYHSPNQVAAELGKVARSIVENDSFLRTVEPKLLVNYVFFMASVTSMCLKHQAFKEEVEWRVIYGPNRWASPLMECSTELVSGIPQTVHKVPFDVAKSDALADLDFAVLFDRLIIGPTQYASAMVEVFVRELKSAGVKDSPQRVIASNIPLRT
jgi:hypothetical protein